MSRQIREMAVRIAAALVGFVWLLAAGADAVAQQRVALVIGNADYRNQPRLPNPVNDATDIGQTLRRLGFEVTSHENADLDTMREALIRFGRRAQTADVAVVFFAGHGIGSGGENWLIPVDATLAADRDVELETISLRSVMAAVEQARSLGLVIVDACRNDPFRATMARARANRVVERGLFRVEPPGNVLVMFAAREGTTADDGEGRNSPFSTALLKHLPTPALEANLLFRRVRDEVITATARAPNPQEPVVFGTLSAREVYLASSPPRPAGAADDAAATESRDRERMAAAIAAARARQRGTTEDRTPDPPPPPPTGGGSANLAPSPPTGDGSAITAPPQPGGGSANPASPPSGGNSVNPAPPPSGGGAQAARQPAEERPAPAAPRPVLVDVRRIQTALRETGCYAGRSDGNWTAAAMRRAVTRFAEVREIPPPDQPTQAFLDQVREARGRVCAETAEPVQQARTEPATTRPQRTQPQRAQQQRAQAERAQAQRAQAQRAQAERAAVRRAAARAESRAAQRRQAPVRSEGACFTAGGRLYCE